MELTKTKINKNAIKLMLLCAVVYLSAYMGRLSYSANISMVCNYYSINNGTAGIVGTCLFVAYGVGQVVNGILCKKYNPRFAISLALGVSSIMNVLVALTNKDSFYFIYAYWFINGFAQSILWSSIIRLLNRNLVVSYLKTAVLVMSFPVAMGTFCAYGVSALFSALNLSFKFVFCVSAIFMFIVAVLWFVSVDRLKAKCYSERVEIDGEDFNVESTKKTEKKKVKLPAEFIAVFVMLAIFAVVNNFIKDGATTWMPKILQEKYKLGEALSTFLTLFLPLGAVFGATIALFLYKVLKSFVSVCGVMYLIAGVLILLVVLLLNTPIWIVTVTSFILVSVSMSTINNVITNIFPMNSSSKINAGMVAGLLDGFCYVGSALTTYCLGSISDNLGWDVVFYIFLAICILMFIVSLVFNIATKKAKNN